jgi:glutathione synthase/RimK-type ligase-like ATP-grasp enzyme
MSKRIITKFRPIILSRHPSHKVLRAAYKALPLNPFRSIIRFGSTTSKEMYELGKFTSRQKIKVELNSIKAIGNSSNKVRMKECFDKENVNTCKWWTKLPDNLEELSFPIIAKLRNGSRGKGMEMLKTASQLQLFINSKNISHYIFEEYFSGIREYRIHVNKNGCFYTCRKMIKSDTPDDKKWFKNDSNCVWYLESNENFDKPLNWNNIVKECVKALNAVGLDFGACDVRVQSGTDRENNIRQNPDFKIIEINSAPSFGEKNTTELETHVAKAYAEMLPKLLREYA